MQRYTKSHTLVARRAILGRAKMVAGAALASDLPRMFGNKKNARRTGDFAQAVIRGAQS